MVFFIFLFPFPFLGVFHLSFRFSPLLKKHTKGGRPLPRKKLVWHFDWGFSSVGRATGC